MKTARILVFVMAVAGAAGLGAQAETVTYNFDDGTLQGWTNAPGVGELFVATNTTANNNGGRTVAHSGHYMALEADYNSRDATDTGVKILTSPMFTVTPTSAVEIWTIGGTGPVDKPKWTNYAGLPAVAGNDFLGAALRRVSDGEYLLFTRRSAVGQSNRDPNWLTVGWDAATIAAAVAGDRTGEKYVIDILDAFSGSWGWIGVDDITLTDVSVSGGSYAFLQSPANGAVDVPRDGLGLSWVPGCFAAGHDVYLGTVWANVEAAVPTSPEYQGRQRESTLVLKQRLELGQTYYWRVDEVNDLKAGSPWKGQVWSFTVEPVAYPVDGRTIKATASSAAEGQGPDNTVTGAGLTGDLHGNDLNTMWLTASGAAGPAWIQYEFDKPLKLGEMWVWNHNGLLESAVGFGAKDVTIEYSADGTSFQGLGTAAQFARASGQPSSGHETIVSFGGVVARFVKLTITSNWGGLLPQYGLSEVRFFAVPVYARQPNPPAGAAEVSVETLLSWRSGREADQHKVYVGTDEQAVIAGTAPATAVTASAYTPPLEVARTYYWRVDEVNAARTPATWPGEVWSFSTEESVVVEDFEGYTDDQQAGQAIFQTWIDGYGTTTNGSQVGNIDAPFAERKIVHGGKQAMPLHYDNTGATNSEATRTFDRPQDWSGHGIQMLALWFHGDPNNAAQQMYLKINSAKIPYAGAAENLKRGSWQVWQINLAGQSVGAVTSLSLGFDRLAGVGGSGRIFIDDIGLHAAPPEVTAVSLIENFDSLAVGMSMHGVPGWEGWYGDPTTGARVTNIVAHSGTHALELVGNRDDLVPHWPAQTSGQWTLKVMQYCPSGKQTKGQMYFGPLSQYDSAGKKAAWIGEFIADFATGKAYCKQDKTIQVPLLYDTWVELRLEVDLYSQLAHFYYNNVFLATRPATSIAGVDIWPDANIAGVYFDDFSFAPAP